MSLTLCDIVEDESTVVAEAYQRLVHQVTDTATASAEAAASVYFTLLVDVVAEESAQTTTFTVVETVAYATEVLNTVYPDNDLDDNTTVLVEAYSFTTVQDLAEVNASEQSATEQRVAQIAEHTTQAVETTSDSLSTLVPAVATATETSTATSYFRDVAEHTVTAVETIHTRATDYVVDTVVVRAELVQTVAVVDTVEVSARGADLTTHRVVAAVEVLGSASAEVSSPDDDTVVVLAEETTTDSVVSTTVTTAYAYSSATSFVLDTAVDTATATETATSAFAHLVEVSTSATETVWARFVDLLTVTVEATELVTGAAQLLDVVEVYARGSTRVISQADVSAWVMNPATSAMSYFTRLPITSIGGGYVTMGGKLFNLLVGDAANASVKTGYLDFKEVALKRFEAMQFYPSASGVSNVTAQAYGEDAVYSYTPTRDRVILGRGLRAYKVQFTVYTGGQAYISEVRVDVAPTSRRV